jgi:hypothetical protein
MLTLTIDDKKSSRPSSARFPEKQIHAALLEAAKLHRRLPDALIVLASDKKLEANCSQRIIGHWGER